MIPKIIHYVWVGGPLPSLQRDYIDSWRRINPDYKFILWNEDNIDFSFDIIKRAHRDRKWAKVADIVRLMAVRQHGGIYLDTDIRLYKPLDSLLACSCVFGFQSKQDTPDWVANGVMAAEPGHWFIKRALEELMALRPLPFGLDRPTKYGPKLITRLLREEGLRRYSADGVWVKDIFVCPTEYFFPFAFGEEFSASCITADTLGVHFWEKSWEKDIPAWLRLAKSVRDRARRLSHFAT